MFWIILAGAIAAAPTRPPSLPAREFTKIAPSGQTRLVALKNGATISAIFYTHEMKIDAQGGPPTVILNNCTYSRTPCVLTDALTITVNGKPILIPRDAFGALTDINAATIVALSSDRYQLIISGGDASEGYVAKLTFNKTRVLERVVESGEANAPAEKSTYFDVSDQFR